MKKSRSFPVTLLMMIVLITSGPLNVSGEEISPDGLEDIPEIMSAKPEEAAEDPVSEDDSETTAKDVKIPSKYNLYKMGRLTKVKDQEPYQSCWAFAIMGAMESDLITDGCKTGINLSEVQLAYYVTNKYKDPRGCRKDTVSKNGSDRPWIHNGGRAYEGLHVLSNLIGAVREKDAPYSKAEDFHPDNSYITSRDYAQLRSASYISVSDRTGIKKAIMEHGGVIASYYDDDEEYYSSKYNSYYCRKKKFNHTVMLVGWDDNFSKKKFKGKKPEANGAWLVRNSFGHNGYSHEGYFWLSYYDAGFNYSKEVIAVDADRKKYDNCYAYDGQPVKDVIKYAKSTDTVSVGFKVMPNETVKAVGFEIRTPDVNTEVTITDKSTGKSVTGSLYTEYAGFYTIIPDKTLKTEKKANIEVTLKFTPKNDDRVAIVCEKEGSFRHGRGNYRYKGVCDKGFKIGSKKINCDPRIKLYTNVQKAKVK